jgi:smad nuclear-interacting protein 1
MPRSRSQSPDRRRDDGRRRRDDRSRRDDRPPREERRGGRWGRDGGDDGDDDERPRRRRWEDEGGDSDRARGRRGEYRQTKPTDRGSRDGSHDPNGERPDERIARRDGEVRARGSAPPTTAAEPPKDKEQANFNTTGLLAAASNTMNGVVLKYSEPSEARKPPGNQRWCLIVFKDADIIDTVELNANSCWLVGRDRAVADLPVDHPSCSKQHAVIQFRFLTKTGDFGDKESAVRPFVVDLESANGTMVNKQRVPESRYVELKDKDMITFGMSSRFAFLSWGIVSENEGGLADVCMRLGSTF